MTQNTNTEKILVSLLWIIIFHGWRQITVVLWCVKLPSAIFIHFFKLITINHKWRKTGKNWNYYTWYSTLNRGILQWCNRKQFLDVSARGSKSLFSFHAQKFECLLWPLSTSYTLFVWSRLSYGMLLWARRLETKCKQSVQIFKNSRNKSSYLKSN